MSVDRSVRSLSALNGASSSRVLNLAAIAAAQAQTGNSKHRVQPFFESPVLNGAIILKHRLRADEADLFSTPRAIATKVIIPFEKTALQVGGRSLFVGQRGYEELLRDAGSYGSKLDMKRDLDVLRLIDNVPSLDPFLLREHLGSNNIRPDASYFEISSADQQRMFDYAATELRRLTNLAVSADDTDQEDSTARMVAALLSSEVNERLEPLRATLNLNPPEFREGVFSWRGFIYYKWSLGELWPQLIKALRDVKTINPVGKVTPNEMAFLGAAKDAILKAVKETGDEVRKVLAMYDGAYASLIERRDPKLFREFLLGAPSLFLEMGEKIGAMSHVTSFWQYRFPLGAPRKVEAEELTMIFQDFTQSLCRELKPAA